MIWCMMLDVNVHSWLGRFFLSSFLNGFVVMCCIRMLGVSLIVGGRVLFVEWVKILILILCLVRWCVVLIM